MRLSLVTTLVAVSLTACAPARGPSGEGSCENPNVTVASWTQDTGMGVNVCIWVDNDTAGTLWVSSWQEWDTNLCGGGPNIPNPDDPLTQGTEVGSGQSAQVLTWGMQGCQRDLATTTDGPEGEPSLVFYVTTELDDETCWTEVRSPRLQGWYCEG